MRSLDQARTVCERYHPGLLPALAEIPFAEREAPGSPAIDLFRKHGGAGLLVPREFGGQGADALDALRVQQAIGALSPSLAAAVCMHHFTAAMLYSLAGEHDRLTPRQRDLLGAIAPGGLVMASGWAEGRTQQNVLLPTVTARAAEGGYLLTGTKKPCSLSGSMDLLTASIAVPGRNGEPELALALIPVPSAGLTVHPFWGNTLLAAAESDEVRLADVFVPREMVVRTSPEDPHRLADLQTAGFIWFETLICAGYVGAAGALVEAVVDGGRGIPAERAALVQQAQAALALLEGAARAVQAGVRGDEAVAAVLVARFAVQDALPQIASRALELLGGLDFVSSPDHSQLAAALRALAFHPPSRAACAEPLMGYFAGCPLELA
ncbi:acyl-CoA dehydrogenase family protein [Streptantibioticus silvisoli]|uniref:Acyl-CoA dehydrogenase family protein n=1 Tax=Streptantibioticus silvisoli TaxID=2705255 RepID=A0ABT6VXL4_9ACTN|nr:acyl-CoA dehydrogenase family protein [Streptantibioticus silvisoli]MDI5962477.1 acyl-CoA dehydrogenase family protein [Streptantibioticus silvisoli]